jgi:hypothetical protein
MHVINVVTVVGWLTLHGCSLPGAIGITANLWVESKLDPTARGSGLGLGQWVGARRKRMLYELSSRWADPYAQLDFIRREAVLRGDWRTTCAASTPALATAAWLRGYERGRGLAQRLAAARWIEAQVGAVSAR